LEPPQSGLSDLDYSVLNNLLTQKLVVLSWNIRAAYSSLADHPIQQLIGNPVTDTERVSRTAIFTNPETDISVSLSSVIFFFSGIAT